MLEHTKAVIFDLDGTLVDSMWVWTAIDEDYIRKYHLNPPEDFHEAMEGMSYTEKYVKVQEWWNTGRFHLAMLSKARRN